MPTIYVALANMGGEVASNDLAIYLERHVPNSRFNAPKPQPNTKGSADIVGVLATIGSIADIYTLASALVNAYLLYVQPFKERNASSALAIRLDNNGNSVSLMIDADTTQEIVIENLCATDERITAERIRIKRGL